MQNANWKTGCRLQTLSGLRRLLWSVTKRHSPNSAMFVALPSSITASSARNAASKCASDAQITGLCANAIRLKSNDQTFNSDLAVDELFDEYSWPKYSTGTEHGALEDLSLCRYVDIKCLGDVEKQMIDSESSLDRWRFGRLGGRMSTPVYRFQTVRQPADRCSISRGYQAHRRLPNTAPERDFACALRQSIGEWVA